MKTAIIGAMEEEVKSLVANMQDVVETHRARTVVYSGKLCGKDVCSQMRCGQGCRRGHDTAAYQRIRH